MKKILKQYRKLNIPSGSLRISITNKCNMKCDYCHNEGQTSNLSSRFMSIDDIRYIISNSLSYGLQKIRLTGGEPLLHPQINDIIKMIYEDLKINNIGINTNGILLQRIEETLDQGYLQQIVIGIDYFEGLVSKRSPIGVSSDTIRNNLLYLCKKYKSTSFYIDYVFHQDVNDLLKMIKWCISNSIPLRVLEIVDFYRQDYHAENFDSIYYLIKSSFNLSEGIIVDLREKYLISNNGTTITFYHSHCNRNECHLCRNIHMRITADGYARPCLYQAEGLFPLLEGDFIQNMNRAIINLGISPQNDLL